MQEGGWDYSSVWEEAVRQIQQEVTEQEFLMWFRNMIYAGAEESRVILSVPSSFYKDQIVQRYAEHIESKLRELLGNKVTIDFTIVRPDGADAEDENETPVPREVIPRRRRSSADVNEKYTFENFVIGENNSFAANASYAIAKNPGTTYNPCLIYGGVGLGKTHLVQYWNR